MQGSPMSVSAAECAVGIAQKHIQQHGLRQAMNPHRIQGHLLTYWPKGKDSSLVGSAN